MKLLSTLSLAAAILTGCARTEEPLPRAPTPVRVRVVAEPPARAQARYSGTIAAATSVDLAFKVGGYVREVAQRDGRKLQEGDLVHKGAVLAVVNEADYRQRVAAAQASLAEAVAAEKQAHVDFERAKKLLAADVINQAEYDGAVAQRDVAAARSAAARSKVSEAALALADCTLRAPIDGVIIRRHIEAGVLAAAGTPAFSLADTRSVKVSFGAPDVLLGRLKLGDTLAVRVEALGEERAGAITRINPSADARSRTFEVETTLDNAGDRLKVGMVVSILLPETPALAALPALPLTAVVRAPRDPRGFAVFVVDPEASVARLRAVTLGDVVTGGVQVVAGLAPGERVVESGATLITDGEAVKVVR